VGGYQNVYFITYFEVFWVFYGEKLVKRCGGKGCARNAIYILPEQNKLGADLSTGQSTVGCWRFGAGISVQSVKSSSAHQKNAFLLCFCLADWEFLCLSFKKLLRIEIKSFGC
jgi:hypothetical protein